MTGILITGASGFLGRKLYDTLKAVGDMPVYGTYLTRPQEGLISLDITDPEQVREVLNRTKPDIIIHAAAMASVDLCEQRQEEAYDANVTGTRNLVRNLVSHADGCTFVFISTDYVFDGSKGSYTEEDAPNPINHYGKTKLEAERAVLAYSRSLVVRVSSLYGYNPHGVNHGFVHFVISNLSSGKQVRAFYDQINCPTLIDDIAPAILKLLRKKKTGLFHLCGHKALSRADIALETANAFKLKASLIERVSIERLSFRQSQTGGKTNLEKMRGDRSFSEQTRPVTGGVSEHFDTSKQPAERPRNSSLDTSRIRAEGIVMHGFKAGLKIMREQMACAI